MREFMSVFQERQDILLKTIWEHLQISLLSLIIAIVIAVPLGIILTRYKQVSEPIIGLAAVVQTIPSLAILAFLIPFFGIGTVPAIVALTAYGLLPRSEEHTSELQSRGHLVCRLLLEKKNTYYY